jgi:hypothetical protein
MCQEIYNEFESAGIVTVIILRRCEWLGHFVRMGDERTEEVSGRQSKRRKEKRKT